jgi:chemosensory pili system protein ChpA (sensor histidine kinase/response regulator)
VKILPAANKTVKASPLCVVMIDDEEAVAKCVAMCLRLSGSSLHATTNPKEAVALVRKTNPDVILCDAAMPDMSGAEVIEKLKADPTTAHIPVVLMSGFPATMFSHVPSTRFLSKPFSPSELLAALHHAVASAIKPAPAGC